MLSNVGRDMNGMRECEVSCAMMNASIVLRKAYFLMSVGIAQLVMFGDMLPPDYSMICNHIQEMKVLTQWNTMLWCWILFRSC
jgi:hypothetical protein